MALVHFPESGSPAPYPAPVCCARTGDYASAGGKPGLWDRQNRAIAYPPWGLQQALGLSHYITSIYQQKS